MSRSRPFWTDPMQWWALGRWLGMSRWARYAVALSVIAASTVLVMLRRGALFGVAFGCLLLALAEPSRAEKNGYHF